MEKYLIRLLMKVSFNAFLIVLVMIVFTQLAFASRSEAQSIAEVHISLIAQSVSLEEIIEEIEQKTEFKFAYLDETARNNNNNISINFRDKSVEDILQEVSQQTGLSFRQVNKTISVKKAMDDPNAVSPKTRSGNLQDEITITGTVTDKGGELLPGVNLQPNLDRLV